MLAMTIKKHYFYTEKEKELVDLVNNTFVRDRKKFAKQAEDNSMWHLAYQIYTSMNHLEDASACLSIHEAIKQGDEYRKRIKEIRELAKKEAEAFIKREIDFIYNEMFKK